MKAIGYKHPLAVTEAGALVDIEIPQPQASGRDLLVRIEAISVNPVDTKIRRMVSAQQGYKILGWDVAGVVEDIGDEVGLFKPGDKVWYAGALDRQGCNAEYQLVDERLTALMPKSLDYASAAAMPLTSITAWELLFDRFGFNRDSKGSLLVIGAAGGVGSMLLQLAAQMTGVELIATASRSESRSWVSTLGAHHVIDHSKSLIDELVGLGIEQVDYIAALTNTADYLGSFVDCIAPQGKIGIIDDPGVLDIMPFKRKSVSFHWEFMFTRSQYSTSDMIEQHRLLTRVADMVDAGEIKSTMLQNYGKINAENLLQAHALLESGQSRGKIVLQGF